MVRFLILYDAPADPEAFDAHYRDVHIPLARKLPGLLRYTVSQGLTTVQGAPTHLTAELDFPDLATMQAAFQSPAGQAAAADVEVLTGGSGVHSMVYEVTEV
jgi:uncharacterized protein (TIGR02118 family)